MPTHFLLYIPARPLSAPPPMEALADLRRVAQDGGAEAWCRLGDCLYDHSIRHKPKEPKWSWLSDPELLEAYRANCVANNAFRHEAAFWYRKALAQGHPPAQYGLGRCLLMVVNSHMLRAEGMAWVRQAAEAGYAPAQLLLGDILQTGGYSLDKDEEEAEKWLLRAAAQGEKEAQRILRQRVQTT